MTGVAELSDSIIVAAAEGSDWARTRLLELLAPQVRLMVRARLAPTPNQLLAVDDLAGQVLTALSNGVGRLENRTAAGLKAFLSSIVQHKVADFIREGNEQEARPAIQSLDSTVADFSRVGPMWQFLSASGVSPRTALDHAERIGRLMDELGRLSAPHREVLILAFFDQLSVGEIADQMQLTRAAASMLLLRALQTLRRAMMAMSSVGAERGRTD
jgi:RNA polymerase sigma factor (sigma-70 family)